jgi:hypothetical protein
MNENENILPEDFDGVFRFTNWTDEEFVGVWGKKEYRFAPQTTSPMIMAEYSPLEIQYIRKKFAKDLGELEFYKSKEYAAFKRQEKNDDGTPRLNSIHMATSYSDNDLTSFIQKCLEPLPEVRAVVKQAPSVDLEETLSRNEDGELNTNAIDRKTSLRKKALEA